MKLSYEGIGQWCATFACTDLAEGALVKISASNTVAACAAGNDIAGMVVSAGRGGDACAVQLGGMVTAAYTGTAPSVGYAILVANGSGGVKTGESGRSRLVTAVDTAAKTVTFVL